MTDLTSLIYRASLFLILLSISTILLAQKDKSKTTADTTDVEKIRINNIYLLGNDKTKPHIIMRELRFEEGDMVTRDQLDELLERSRNNVYNTNLFHSVQLQKLQTDSTTLDVLIKVEERWYVWPSPVFRLADRSFNDWWYNRDHDISRVNYGLKLDMYNFRGLKENLRFVALTGFEQRFIFLYSMPFIDKNQKHGLTFSGTYMTNKKLRYETDQHLTIFTDSTLADQINRRVQLGYVMYTYRPSYNNYHYVTLQGYKMSISDTVAALNPNFFLDGSTQQRAFGLTYSFFRDMRNNKNYPLTGYKILATVEKLGLGVFNDIDIWRVTGNAYKYFDLGNKFYANTSLGIQITSSKNVPYYNYTQFGLENYYVRGYELSVIEGPQNVLTKNTLKYQLFKTQAHLGDGMPIKKFRKIPFAFYPKIIADAGWVNNYKGYTMSDKYTNKLLFGVGPGLDIVTLYDITLRLEYTYNAEGQFNFFLNFQQEL